MMVITLIIQSLRNFGRIIILLYIMLSEVFWVAFVATTSAMVIKLASLCFKSKCRECSVCGGRIKIIRDIDAEVKEEEFRTNSKDKEEGEEK